MHWQRSWVCVVIAFAGFGAASSNAGRVEPRQGSTLLPQGAQSLSPAPSNSSGISSMQGGQLAQVPSTTDASSTQTPSSFITSLLPTSTMAASTNISAIIIDNYETLPITPTITPALSVAGVLLILSGTVYALIGIKNREIQIFLSAAYLSSLSITVLIIYVMNLPVSNAIQAAYFAGAFVPALIIGGGALIFRDFTEGLGCLIGGFCVAMWILVLKAGGLITSTAGKTIFIAVFCIGFFGLSFSHRTRYYGLIGSTSFVGATAIVLGIDCLSRAGLKEFWLYIWALNDNLFPVLTFTYPITRGIRVEIAAVIVLACIGVLAQFKIWRVLRERRKKQVMEKDEEQMQREQAEEEIGRRLVAGNGREQVQWEATYGDQTLSERQQVDSGLGTETNSIRKVSISTAEPRPSGFSQSHPIELSNLDQHGRPEYVRSGKISGGPTVSVHAAPNDERMQSANGEQSPQARTSLTGGSRFRSMESSRYKELPAVPSEYQEHTRSSAPKLSPLTLKRASSNIGDSDDTSSIATSDSSTRPQRRSLKRFSGSSLLRKITKRSQRNSLQRLTSDDGQNTAQDQGDAAALMPATSHSRQNEMSSPRSGHIRENSIGLSINPEDVLVPESDMSSGQFSVGEAQIDDPIKPAGEEAPQLAGEYRDETEGLDENGASSPNELEEQRKSSLRPLSEVPEETEYTTASRGVSDLSAESASRHGLEGRLPEAGPKVASVYRTNEWAKHLDGADKPEVDRLRMLKPSESQESESSEEAVPVDIQALQSTPLTQQSSPESYPQPRSPSSIPRNFLSEYMATQQQIPQQRSSTDPLKRKPVGSLLLKASHPSTITSNQLSTLKTKNIRSSSSPITTSPIVASPIEEGVETTVFPSRYVSSPLAPTTTLLSQRNSFLQNKHLTPNAPVLSRSPPSSTSSLPSSLSRHSLDDESITLAQRRSLLRAQAPTNPLPSQPPLDPSARRASQLAAWRSSLQLDLQSSPYTNSPDSRASAGGMGGVGQAMYEADMRRAQLLEEKHREQMVKQREVLRDRERDLQWDQQMRRGDMLEAHREVLRRMQVGVNERLRLESAGG